jgi:hypothetical protein
VKAPRYEYVCLSRNLVAFATPSYYLRQQPTLEIACNIPGLFVVDNFPEKKRIENAKRNQPVDPFMPPETRTVDTRPEMEHLTHEKNPMCRENRRSSTPPLLRMHIPESGSMLICVIIRLELCVDVLM